MVVDHALSPIIIYGAPRSGTTYLNSILNQHPDIFITHETRLFVWAHRSLNVLPQDDKAVLSYRKQFVTHLFASFPQLISDFYRSIKKRGARFWGDKNPHYADGGDVGCLETIASLFPEARFIHILRDGRDVVTSLLRKQWVDFETAHRIWPTFVDRGCDFGRRQSPGRYLELRYEDLLREDLAVARSVFDFLDIPIHEHVIDYCHTQRQSRTPLSEPTRDLKADVTISDWKKWLTVEEQLLSLELLGPNLVKYGYETNESFMQLYRQTAEQRAFGILHPVAQSIRDAVRSVVPTGATVVVISKGDDALLKLDGSTGWHFPQAEDGEYLGYYPANSLEAVSHLESLREEGAKYLVIPWFSTWWLQHYGEFAAYLERHALRILEKDGVCVIFELGRAEPSAMTQSVDNSRIHSDTEAACFG